MACVSLGLTSSWNKLQVLKLLHTAKANRSVAKTIQNDRSSRSHSVFQLCIKGYNTDRALRCACEWWVMEVLGVLQKLGGAQGWGGVLWAVLCQPLPLPQLC